MLYIAKVEVKLEKYMGETKDFTKMHTVNADSEEEARDKIDKFYREEKSDDYGDQYRAWSIELFEHIG